MKPLFLALSIGLLPLPLSALTFPAAVFDSANSSASRPLADPTGVKLAGLANAVAEQWESYLLNNHNVTTLTLRYDTAAPAEGALDILGFSGGKVTNMRIRIKPASYFFDPTPDSHTEYELLQKLERELPTGESYPFTGTPPQVLEVAYSGTGSGGAAFTVDLLTLLHHHFARALGFSDTFSAFNTEVSDGDCDLTPSHLGGAAVAIQALRFAPTDDYSIPITGSLLHPASLNAVGKRTLPSVLDILAVAKAGSWSSVHVPRCDWIANGPGTYPTAISWVGGLIPDAEVDVFLRQPTSTPITSSHTRGLKSLFIGGNSKLTQTANNLIISENITIQYEGGLTSFPTLSTETGARIQLEQNLNVLGGTLNNAGGNIDVRGTLNLSSNLATGRRGRLTGRGTHLIHAITNSGEIIAADPTYPLIISPHGAFPDTPWDLDGDSASSETILSADQGDLTLNCNSLTDSFDGTVIIGNGRTFDLKAPWTLGATGRILMDTATLKGLGGLKIDGALELSGSSSTITSDLTFRSGSTLDLDTSDLLTHGYLELQSGTTISNSDSANAKIISEEDNLGTPAVLWLGDGLNTQAGIVNNSVCHLGTPTTSADTVASIYADIFTCGPDSELRLTVTDLPQIPNHDKISSFGSFIDGTIKIDFQQVANPQDGQTWTLISASKSSNISASIEFISVPPGFTAQVIQTLSEFSVRLNAATTAGTFAAWAADRGIPQGQRSPHQDFDQDGITNALEAYLGTNPTTPNPMPQPEFTTVTVNNITYPALRADLAEDLSFTDIDLLWQESTNLQNWTPLENFGGSFPISGRNRVTYYSDTPLSGSPARFFRLKVVDRIQHPSNPL